MKRTPARPRPPSQLQEETGGDLEAPAGANARKNTTSTANTIPAAVAPPSLRKSPLPVEKGKRRSATNTTSRGVPGPTRSAKEKESPARKRKSASAEASGSESSGTFAATDDSLATRGNSGIHGESEENHATSNAHSRRLKLPGYVHSRELTESLCKKQLAALRAKDKRPPPPMTAEMFADTFRLPHRGINSHKQKIGRDIALEEVEAVFGPEKSKNGFSLAEKLSATLRKDAEKLYCLCYQKPYAPVHVAKEFAIGFVLDKVQRKDVNWAEFAAETNEGQRKSYSRRLRGCIARLATALDVPTDDLYEKEGFGDYAEKDVHKFSVGDVKCEGGWDGSSGVDVKTRLSLHYAGSPDPHVLAHKCCTITLCDYCLHVKKYCLVPAVMDSTISFLLKVSPPLHYAIL